MFCENLLDERFVCGCQKYHLHCYIEFIVKNFVEDDEYDSVRTEIGEYIMEKCLKNIVINHYPSLINLLRYLLKNMSSKHASFILQMFKSHDVGQLNLIDYIPLL